MLRILIVEDDSILAREWQEDLENTLNCTVDVAANSVVAMPLLEKFAYDCHILDLFYEKQGTFEPIGGIRLIPVISKLPKKKKNSSIIAVTGHYYDDPKISTGDILQTLGVEHILQKPVAIQGIISLIKSLHSVREIRPADR